MKVRVAHELDAKLPLLVQAWSDYLRSWVTLAAYELHRYADAVKAAQVALDGELDVNGSEFPRPRQVLWEFEK